YDQRVAAASDPELAEILAHNRDEEKEHAAMVLEWLRRHDATLNHHLKTYLFTDSRITEIEEAVEEGASTPENAKSRAASADSSLGLRSLKVARGVRGFLSDASKRRSLPRPGARSTKRRVRRSARTWLPASSSTSRGPTVGSTPQ